MSFLNINQSLNNEKAKLNKQLLEQINETLKDAGLLSSPNVEKAQQLTPSNFYVLQNVFLLCADASGKADTINQACYDKLIDIISKIDLQEDLGEECVLQDLASEGVLTEERLDLLAQQFEKSYPFSARK